jgi:hypothetical protein
MEIETLSSGKHDTGASGSSRAAVYSPVIGALGALIGGPFAAVALAALNAHRLQRLERDRFWLGSAAVVAGSTIVGAAWLAVHFQEREPAFRERFYLLTLAVGLGLWAAFCARQRTSTALDGATKDARWFVHGLSAVALSAVLRLVLNAITMLSLR